MTPDGQAVISLILAVIGVIVFVTGLGVSFFGALVLSDDPACIGCGIGVIGIALIVTGIVLVINFGGKLIYLMGIN